MLKFLLLPITILGLAALGCAHSEHQAKPATEAAQKVAEATTKAKTEVAKAQADVRAKVECALKTEKRDLEIREKGKGCVLSYTKGGKAEDVATGSNGTAYCQKALEKISGNLKTAGYECH